MFKAVLEITEITEIVIFSTSLIIVLFSAVGSYSLLRISIRGIADASDELLDQSQLLVRNTAFDMPIFS
jgi:hypothetical protein